MKLFIKAFFDSQDVDFLDNRIDQVNDLSLPKLAFLTFSIYLFILNDFSFPIYLQFPFYYTEHHLNGDCNETCYACIHYRYLIFLNELLRFFNGMNRRIVKHYYFLLRQSGSCHSYLSANYLKNSLKVDRLLLPSMKEYLFYPEY